MSLFAWLALLPLLLLALLSWELLRLLRAQAPAQTQVRSLQLGSALPQAGAGIPKLIWSYWNSETLPPLIQACADNWRAQAPDHQLHLLTPATVGAWLPQGTDLSLMQDLPPFRQADWLRLQLLKAHGGLWIDASTLLTGRLDWVHAQQASSGAEFVGFYIDRLSNRAELPMVENWFMAAVPGSRFIADLNTEFVHALQMGEAAYLQSLRDTGRFERVMQAIDPSLHEYLIMHVAASSLLDADASRYRLALQRAEDSAFALQQALGWRKRHLYAKLALCPCPARVPALIKLRGNDRRVLEQQLQKRPARRGSLLDRYLPTLRPAQPASRT